MASLQHTVSERQRVGLGTATAERLAKTGEDGREADPTGRQRIVAAPLDRLWKAGFITQREFEAGDKYRADAYMAAIDPGSLSVDWSRTAGGTSSRVPTVFTAQHIADARRRIRMVERAIPHRSVVSLLLFFGVVREFGLREIGAQVFGIHDRKDAVLCAKAGLRVALASLADYYGS